MTSPAPTIELAPIAVGDNALPDITDTGTIIGNLNLQPPSSSSPTLVIDDINNNNDTTTTSPPKLDPSTPIINEDEEDPLETIEKLRSETPTHRIEASTKLPTIAHALGPQRTRDELLPFLCDGMDDDDEVLEVIATSLGQMLDCVGGTKYGTVLLTPLELLLSVEESAVREKAIQSVITISSSLSSKDYKEEYIPMIQRLATKEWYTGRISACALIPVAFPKLDNDKVQYEYLECYCQLCKDDVPMVRRIACKNLGRVLFAVVESLGLESVMLDGNTATTHNNTTNNNGGGKGTAYALTLLDLYELLAGGDQPDSVRLHMTQNCVWFGRAMALLLQQSKSSSSMLQDESEIKLCIDTLVKRILPLIGATIDDRSWRVRWTAASKFADVVHAFQPLEGAMDALVPNYEKLLQDPEAEVRTAATYNLSEVAKTEAWVYPVGWSGGSDSENGMDIDEEEEDMDGSGGKKKNRITVAQRLVTRLIGLTEDDSVNVRAALGMVATELAPLLGKDASISNLLPPMLLLLRDSSSEVRLNVISSLSLLNDVIGTDLLHQSLLPAILDLADDGKWRIRLAVIERIPLLAKQLGGEFFDDRLLSLCVGWLGDDISSIREAAAKNLQELTTLLGTEWSVQNLFPRVRQVMEHPSYLRRMNAVQAVALMATAMDANSAQMEVLPILLEMHYDPVPNVRFNVAKGLGTVGTLFDRSIYQGQIIPILTLMESDPDRDVRYFASKTRELLSSSFEKST